MKKILSLLLVVISIVGIAIPASAATVSPAGWHTYVDTTNAKVYKSASTSATSVTVPSGIYLECSFKPGVNPEWVYVKGTSSPYTGNTGYIRLNDLHVINNNLVAGFFGSSTMKVGDTGDAVGWLHAFLKELNFINYSGTASTTFTSSTENAVKSFQRYCGLTADGKVGINTKFALVQCVPRLWSCIDEHL